MVPWIRGWKRLRLHRHVTPGKNNTLNFQDKDAQITRNHGREMFGPRISAGYLELSKVAKN